MTKRDNNYAFGFTLFCLIFLSTLLFMNKPIQKPEPVLTKHDCLVKMKNDDCKFYGK